MDLNVGIIKLLEKIIGLNLHDPVFGKEFLDITPKTWATKAKKNRLVGLYQN